MILTSPTYDPATARSLVIHSPAQCFWAIDPSAEFHAKYRLPNGGRIGLIKKDMGKREVKRRGWDGDNTNYGHSLSLKNEFIASAAFHDVLTHFNTLHPNISDTTPCAGVNFYGTKLDFTIMESIAFFLFHGFQLHLDPGFLSDLPVHLQEDMKHLQARLSQKLVGWNETLKTIAGDESKPLPAPPL